MSTQPATRVFFFGVLTVLVSPGCGGSGGNGGTAPSPTATGITINAPNNATMFAIGQTFTFTASANMSNGTTQTAAGTWGTDAPAVATASGNGDVRFVGSGDVTVFVDYAGMRGTKRVRGLPSYQGTWVGSYSVSGCEHSGAFATVNFCGDFPSNRVLPLGFVFTQTNDSITGTTSLGTLRSNQATGPIALDGTLALPAMYQDGTFTLTESWLLQSREAGKITGRVVVLWRASGYSGEARLSGDLFNVNRTSTVAALPAAAPPAPRTLQELIRAVTR